MNILGDTVTLYDAENNSLIGQGCVFHIARRSYLPLIVDRLTGLSSDFETTKGRAG